MATGTIARVEELTRIPADVQDTLISILSEKTLPIPELGEEVQARKGFNVIATANNRDKGVNELSSALKRRFNTVVLPTPETVEEEVDIVKRRVEALGSALEIPAEPPAADELRRIVTVFRELRDGKSADGKTKLKTPSGSMSTAEAIGVVNQGSPSPPTSATAGSGPPTSPPAWSGRSSKIRYRTRSSGRSTWRRS
jgi:MoxR-like ATPase